MKTMVRMCVEVFFLCITFSENIRSFYAVKIEQNFTVTDS